MIYTVEKWDRATIVFSIQFKQGESDEGIYFLEPIAGPTSQKEIDRVRYLGPEPMKFARFAKNKLLTPEEIE